MLTLFFIALSTIPVAWKALSSPCRASATVLTDKMASTSKGKGIANERTPLLSQNGAAAIGINSSSSSTDNPANSVPEENALAGNAVEGRNGASAKKPSRQVGPDMLRGVLMMFMAIGTFSGLFFLKPLLISARPFDLLQTTLASAWAATATAKASSRRLQRPSLPNSTLHSPTSSGAFRISAPRDLPC